MPDADPRILEIVERVLDDGITPQDACVDAPDLLPLVLRRLAAMRALDAELETVFPSTHSHAKLPTTTSTAEQLPDVPGYIVERICGRGGVGVVYRARHIKLDRLVAIKMLIAPEYAGPRETDRFMREARTIAALCHPNIVQIFDVGECDGFPYFTMELMEGGTLADTLAGVPQPATSAASRLLTLARAVEAAHARSIVHRDLKPANILLTSDGVMKVADFGLAHTVRADVATELTINAGPVGTPSYMSPEQAGATPSGNDTSVDIYAIGAILYEMLTGRPPFHGETSAETLRQVLNDDPVAPARLNPRTPRDLQTICLKCLEKPPANRYASMHELAEDLERYIRNEPILARPVGPARRVWKWSRRHPLVVAASALACMLLIAGLVVGSHVSRLRHERDVQHERDRANAHAEISGVVRTIAVLRTQRRWVEGESLYQTALSRVDIAADTALAEALDQSERDLQIARELDALRQNYPEPSSDGYTFAGAAETYDALFTRIGIPAGVDPAVAAHVIRASALRDDLLIALDHAAFVVYVHGAPRSTEEYLALALAADPDPHRDRFRQVSTWRDQSALLATLATNALTAEGDEASTLPTHQTVIAAVLLSGLRANDRAIDILTEAQKSNPADYWVNHELANVLGRSGRPLEAAQFRRAALALRPDNFVQWTSLGINLGNQTNVQPAIAAFQTAVRLKPEYAYAWDRWIALLCSRRMWPHLQETIEAMQRECPNCAAAVLPRLTALERARLSASRADWADALRAYTQARDDNTLDGEAPFELACVQLLTGDAEGYRGTVRAMILQAINGDVRPYLAIRAVSLAPWDVSPLPTDDVVFLSELSPVNTAPWALTLRGTLALRQHDAQTSVTLFTRSLDADARPGSAILNWLQLACAENALGNADRAAQWRATAHAWFAEHPKGMPLDADAISLHLHNWLEACVLRAAGCAPAMPVSANS